MSTEPTPEERATIERWRATVDRATLGATLANEELPSQRGEQWVDSVALVSIALSLSVIAEVVIANLEPDR